MWDRFVNSRGGIGNNIPCDLYNEHINKQVKHIKASQGPNLTEASVQCAARSVSTVEALAKVFDKEANVPVRTVRHSTTPDDEDVYKVASVAKNCSIMSVTPNRCHVLFPNFRLNPLWNRRTEKSVAWIEKKKAEYSILYGNMSSASDIELVETETPDISE